MFNIKKGLVKPKIKTMFIGDRMFSSAPDNEFSQFLFVIKSSLSFVFSEIFSLGVACQDDLCSFLPTLKMSLYHLLACTVSDEKCCSFLCKVSFFSLSSFTTFSLILSFFNMMHQDVKLLLFCSAWGSLYHFSIWKPELKSAWGYLPLAIKGEAMTD